MNRDCQEKKNKNQSQEQHRENKKNKSKKETERAHNHAFQEKKQLTIRYSIKEQNQTTWHDRKEAN